MLSEASWGRRLPSCGQHTGPVGDVTTTQWRGARALVGDNIHNWQLWLGHVATGRQINLCFLFEVVENCCSWHCEGRGSLLVICTSPNCELEIAHIKCEKECRCVSTRVCVCVFSIQQKWICAYTYNTQMHAYTQTVSRGPTTQWKKSQIHWHSREMCRYNVWHSTEMYRHSVRFICICLLAYIPHAYSNIQPCPHPRT